MKNSNFSQQTIQIEKAERKLFWTLDIVCVN